MHPVIVRQLQLLLIALDVLLINVVFFIVRFVFEDQQLSGANEENTYLGFNFSLTWLFVSFFTNVYKGKYIFSCKEFTKKSINALAYFFALVLLYLFLYRHVVISHAFLTITMLCIPVALLLSKTIYFFIYRILRFKKLLSDKVLIIGYNELSKKLIHSLEENAINKEIVGICDELENVKELHHYPILSSISSAVEICEKFGATDIYTSIAPESNPGIYKLIQLADEHCIHFHIIPDTSVFVNRQCYINYISGVPVISLRIEPLEVLSNRIIKEVFDIVFSFLVVVLILSWMIPIIGLLIRLESKGPVFFKQIRSGKGNKKFACIKFRSMRINELANEIQASKNDERLTRVGKFLRRTSLDEFPQFLNVLKGDMSVVGPRPHMLKHTMEYSKMMNQYMVRHFLKPGITGWAQVNGFRGEINCFEKLQRRVEHDLWYLENWSLWLDIKIILMTVVNAFKGDRNAY